MPADDVLHHVDCGVPVTQVVQGKGADCSQQGVVRFDGGRTIQLEHRVVQAIHESVYQRAVVARNDVGGGIELHEPVVASQRPFVFAVEPLDSGFNEIDNCVVGSFSSQASDFITSLLLLPAKQVNEYH